MKKWKILTLIVFTTLLTSGWLIAQTVYAGGTTFTVNRTNDASDRNIGDGICDVSVNAGDQCTLRAAIEELNALGPDIDPHHIEFDIIGTEPITLTFNSELPAITVPLGMNGESQPGASCPTFSDPAHLLIVLDGSNSGSGVSGLALNSGSQGSTIGGLVIVNFDQTGIALNSDNNTVRCNHIGVGVGGNTDMGNGGNGISINSDYNTIGGQGSPTRRNVISGNGGGINLQGSQNIIRNNLIGTTADGLNPLGNGGSGIYQGNGEFNIIGGTIPLARNVIGDHIGNAITIRNDHNTITGNYIGVGRDGVTAIPNATGISVEGSANIVGGTASGEGNLIANQDYFGVRVAGTGPPVDNPIRGNAIFNNGTLGIDLGDDGVDTNDFQDLDTGANEGQNYPILNSTTGTNSVSGALNSTPNTEFSIDVYRNDECDSSGYGEGQEYLGGDSVTTNASGNANFTINLITLSNGTGSMTATATDPDGNTSEFSACIPITPIETPTPTPTNMPPATATATMPTMTTTPPVPSPTNTAEPTATGTPPTPTPTVTGTPPTPAPTATTFPAGNKLFLPMMMRQE